jgi:hypothetical protein
VLISSLNCVLLILIVLLRTAYSLVMYSSSVQGRLTAPHRMRHPHASDLLRVFNHLIWIGLIIFTLGIINI